MKPQCKWYWLWFLLWMHYKYGISCWWCLLLNQQKQIPLGSGHVCELRSLASTVDTTEFKTKKHEVILKNKFTLSCLDMVSIDIQWVLILPWFTKFYFLSIFSFKKVDLRTFLLADSSAPPVLLLVLFPAFSQKASLNYERFCFLRACGCHFTHPIIRFLLLLTGTLTRPWKMPLAAIRRAIVLKMTHIPANTQISIFPWACFAIYNHFGNRAILWQDSTDNSVALHFYALVQTLPLCFR